MSSDSPSCTFWLHAPRQNPIRPVLTEPLQRSSLGIVWIRHHFTRHSFKDGVATQASVNKGHTGLFIVPLAYHGGTSCSNLTNDYSMVVAYHSINL
jgi:hypothetical protein